MNSLGNFFPIFLYVLGSILLILIIILVVKLISTIDKTNEILDDINRKSKSLDGLFNAIDTTTGALSTIGDKIIDCVVGLISRFGKNKRKKRKEEETDE